MTRLMYRTCCQVCGAPLDHADADSGIIRSACGRYWHRDWQSEEWRMWPEATALDPVHGSCPNVVEGSPRW